MKINVKSKGTQPTCQMPFVLSCEHWKFIANVVVGLLDNESPDSNRLTLVTPKSENDVRLQATLCNQNPTGLPVGAVSPAFSDDAFSFTLAFVNEKLTLSMDAFVRKGRFPLLNFYWRESTIIGFGFTLKG